MWFIFTLMCLSLLFVVLMPKRLSPQEMYITWITVVCVNVVVDVLGAHVFHLYAFMGTSNVTWQAILPKLVFSPSLGIIFLNYLPRERSKHLLYVACWTAFSLLVEFGAIQSGFLQYTGWRFEYSLIFYAIALPYMVWHLSFTRKRS